MSSPKHNSCRVIALLCGLAYLATLPNFPQFILVSLMHGGHAVQVVEHGGHEDLVFYHHDDEAAGEHPAFPECHAGSHHEHDHMVCLGASGPSTDFFDSASRTPFAAAFHASVPSILTAPEWRMSVPRVLARAPPLIGGGVLICLRTTVLVV